MKIRLPVVSCLILAMTAVCGRAAEPSLKIDLGKGVTLEMVLVKKGHFRQGSPDEEGGRGTDERQREVTLTKDFYLGKYPVTVAQFRRFVDDTGYLTEAEQGSSGGFGFDGQKLAQRKDFNWKKPGYAVKDDCPVTMVTYDDAFAFVFWLNDKAGRKCTLPTEAQWEYACRAGTTTPYYSGTSEDDLGAIGWYLENSDKAAQPVGKKRPNAFGLYDMSGNVFEWCRDWYAPYGGDDATDPLQARSNLSGTSEKPDPPRRVLRGGSWLRAAHFSRSASRYRNNKSSRNADNGFRVEIEVQDDAALSIPHAPRDAVHDAEREEHAAPRVVKADMGLFGIVFLLIVAVIIYQVIKSLSGQMRFPQPPPGRPQWPQGSSGQGAGGSHNIEPAADGFWIHPIGYPIGSVIYYRYQVFGAPHNATALVESGGRQFIYTGETPTDIAVTQIVPAAEILPTSEPQSNWPATGGGFPASTPDMPRDDSSAGGGSFGEEPAPSFPAPAGETPSAPSSGYPSAY